jgi:hypothetical protein
VPSVFFIGSNGIPIEIVAGSKSPEELIATFNKVTEVCSFVRTFGSLHFCYCFAATPRKGSDPAPASDCGTGISLHTNFCL